MNQIENTILIFDIGKTHVKVTLVTSDGQAIYQNRTSNKVLQTEPYDSFDIEHIWSWLLNEITQLTPHNHISAISIGTHGATAALVDPAKGRLLLPVMDYEFDDYPIPYEEYLRLRPSFSETGSPAFPAGLNLGRQLHWQSQLLSDEDKRKAVLLLYPQYWAWRLTGLLASEITSLGCHTDLWNIASETPSLLLRAIGLEHALPPLTPAWEPLGNVRNSIAKRTGLSEDCTVYPGLHDSNAGYVSILKRSKDNRPTVVSSGTWTIIMDGHADVSRLNEARDMLVNVDAEGNPLGTARFMGGREFGLICEKLNTDIATTFTDEDIRAIIDAGIQILPSFCQGTGPYPDSNGVILSESRHLSINGKAAATLYAALMITDILDRLSPGSKRDILMEGSFAANEVLCRLLAALNPERTIRIQNQGNGVTQGCYLLTKWDDETGNDTNKAVAPYQLASLITYAERWKALVRDR